MSEISTKSCPSCFKDIDRRALRCPFCSQRQTDVVGLYRDVPGYALSGVCAALARHFNWDVTLMRIAFIVSVAFTGFLSAWVYGALWLMTPFGPDEQAPLSRGVDAVTRLFSKPSALDSSK